ncbi:hypothetical protein SAMN05216390_10319 [Lachnospiraceae bacterium KH1T2]|nr:hypothetical protein SAMN05216390_10319 [Lachnospiraceae bacterium KH1T2]
MNTVTIVLLVILVVLIAAIVALYFLGKRLQKKQEEGEAAIEATKMTIPLLVIDKKIMKIKDAGLPNEITSQIPKWRQRIKVMVVKAKIGGYQMPASQKMSRMTGGPTTKVQSQIVTLICDRKEVYDSIPVKKEVKATVGGGIHIIDVKGVHGNTTVKPEQKKKSKFQQFKENIQKKAGAKPL